LNLTDLHQLPVSVSVWQLPHCWYQCQNQMTANRAHHKHSS